MRVLALNCGSSSIKFALVDPADGSRAIEGMAQRLGQPEASLRWSGCSGAGSRAVLGADHQAALAAVLALVEGCGAAVDAVGHRVVHGGEACVTPTVLDDAAVAGIAAVSHLAPLHNPANLAGIAAARALWPRLPQAAVFDTAFHHTVPPRAHRYAVPEDWYRAHGLRRYGFHGISHRFVARAAARLLARPLAETALVTAHLGNGCSACAVLGGESVDTTMGLTPLEGLVMGTRSGDLDPGAHAYLCQRLGIDVHELTRRLNRDCGLSGVSAIGNDMRAVLAAADRGDQRATLAVELFCYRLAKAIAALCVPLGRLDALVFTGGIGEHAAPIRARAIDLLGVLGLRLDPVANATHGAGRDGRIALGTPTALVVATDEERLIAEDTAAAIAARS